MTRKATNQTKKGRDSQDQGTLGGREGDRTCGASAPQTPCPQGEQQPRQGFPRYDQPVGGMMERRRGYRSIHNAIVEKGRVHAHDMLDVGEVRTVVGDIAEGDEQGINSKPDHHHDLRI